MSARLLGLLLRAHSEKRQGPSATQPRPATFPGADPETLKAGRRDARHVSKPTQNEQLPTC
jgi:hypothetical protein